MRLKDEDLKEIARLVDEGFGTSYIVNKFSYPRGNMHRLITRYEKHGLDRILHG